MGNFRTIVGSAIAGIFVMSVWGAFAAKYGIAGGWFAGFIIIGTAWFFNHCLGVIDNQAGAAPVDQALGIGIAGSMRDVFMAGSISPLIESLPTLLFVGLGGIAGAVCAAMFQQDLAKARSAAAKAQSEATSRSA
ncbi:MAG TPA: hypothetical protein PKA10_00655 [Selenomonadales bacterium]|nr:hypothetical protein [Selenomonadales bacterium]